MIRLAHATTIDGMHCNDRIRSLISMLVVIIVITIVVIVVVVVVVLELIEKLIGSYVDLSCCLLTCTCQNQPYFSARLIDIFTVCYAYSFD
jgi:hypothetical protein